MKHHVSIWWEKNKQSSVQTSNKSVNLNHEKSNKNVLLQSAVLQIENIENSDCFTDGAVLYDTDSLRSFVAESVGKKLNLLTLRKGAMIFDIEWYNEWQRVTTIDNEWQQVVQRVTRVTKNDSKWQRMTTSDNEWCNKWQRVTTSNATSDNEWQQIAMSESEWQQWYNQWKRHRTLQRMDDCRPFNDKNRYTTNSRDGWLQLEWLNK